MDKHTRTLSVALLAVLVASSMGGAFAAAATPVSEAIAHRFTEDHWAIRYDVLSHKLVEDLTPGPYSDELNTSLPDQAPYRDAVFYIAYMNLGQVQTVYMAFDSFSNDNRNQTYFGVSPYQLIQQHFRTGGGHHVIVQNAFTGLVAYKENGTANGVPNRNDSLYYGDSFNNQLYKFLLNRLLAPTVGYAPFDMNVTPAAIPQGLTWANTSTSFEYTFGMDYTNLFLVWYPINLQDDVNELTAARDILGRAVAFSELSYLNFSYTLAGDLREDRPVNITLTTEYDIGPITDLWIVNDNQTLAEAIGGDYYNIPLSVNEIAHYNTTAAITTRLSGTPELPGFSLAVSNYARIINIAATVEDATDTEVVDGAGDLVDGEEANQNVTRLALRSGDDTAYNIDFASKPNYTLNGSQELVAPVKLYPHARVRNPIFNRLDGLAYLYLNAQTRAMVQARIERINERFDLAGKQLSVEVSRRNVFYAICFPEWGGQSVWQDPTFTAFANPEDLLTNGGLLSRIDGYAIGVVGLAGLTAITLLILNKRGKRI